jgi:glutaredoxin
LARSATVTLYHAEGCHLCERARAVLEQAREQLEFDLEEVDIGGKDELEAKYREWLPVVEIDGKRAFVYFVDPEALRRRLSRPTTGDTKAGA